MLRINAKVARSYCGRGLVVGGLVGLLLGCPLYDDECESQDDCASGFRCDRFSQRCEPAINDIGCRRPEECLTGETCTPELACRPGSCDFHGCVAGYRCGVVDSAYACVPETGGGGREDAAAPVGTGGAAGDSGAAGAAGMGPTGAEQDAGGVGDASADASL